MHIQHNKAAIASIIVVAVSIASNVNRDETRDVEVRDTVEAKTRHWHVLRRSPDQDVETETTSLVLLL